MAIAIRLEILVDGPRSGTEIIDPNLVASQLDGTYSAGDEPLHLDWTLTEVARIVELSARLHGQLRYACARCSDPLHFPVSVDISHHWVPLGDLFAGDDDTDDFERDPDVSEHDGLEIDIEPIVLECVVVEFPFAPACDVSAEGRCPEWTDEPRVIHPGGEAPVVERKSPFAALAALKLGPEAEG